MTRLVNMTKPVLDDRTFENAVSISEEAQASNNAFFEAKGYAVTVEDPAAPPADPKAPVAPVDPPADAVVDPAVDPAPAPAAVEHPDLDDESRADWNSATTDEARLGRYAKRTKRLKELEAQLEDTKRQLEEKSRQPANASQLATQVTPVATVDPTKATEPTKPQAAKFEKPQPPIPRYTDFTDADDPTAAHADAVAAAIELRDAWKEEKQEFEAKEAKRVEDEYRAQKDQYQEQVDLKRMVDQKFESARKTYSDFDTITSKTSYSPTVAYLVTQEFEDGFTLAYELAKPENAAYLKELNEATPADNSSPERQKIASINAGNRMLAVFRQKLLDKAAASKVDPPSDPVTPPPAPAAVAAPVAPQAPPVVTQPRKEDAAPTPVRGRAGVPAERPEDVDPMDSDARRKLRKQLGQN